MARSAKLVFISTGTNAWVTPTLHATFVTRLDPSFALAHRVLTFFHIWFHQNQIFQYPLLDFDSRHNQISPLTGVSHFLRSATRVRLRAQDGGDKNHNISTMSITLVSPWVRTTGQYYPCCGIGPCSSMRM